MSHPLQQKLIGLRRRVRRMTALRGLCIVAATLLVAGMALGAIDHWLRFEGIGLRMIVSLAFWGVLGWTSYRFLFLALSAPIDEVALALRVERCFPELKGRLASAVDFLRAGDADPMTGSAALRRAVVAQAAAESERIDLTAILDRRPVVRAVAALAAVSLAVGALIAIDPSGSWIAVARLANPLGVMTPRDDIQAVEPPKIESVRIRVIPPAYAGRPAETAAGSIRALAGSRVQIIGVCSKPLRSAVLRIDDRRRVPARLRDDGREFLVEFTVERSGFCRFELTDRDGLSNSGDDDGWPIVAVVDAPPTVWIERPAADLVVTPSAVVPLRIAVRDDLAIRRISIAFQRVDEKLHSPDQPSVGARKGAGGEGLSGEETAKNDMQNANGEGSISGLSFDIFRSPLLTPHSSNPQSLIPNHSDTSPHPSPLPKGEGTNRSLHSKGEGTNGSLLPEGEGTDVSFLPAEEGSNVGDCRVVDYRWDLALLELVPGTRLTFQATAEDWRPQTGQSRLRQLTIVSAEQLQDRIADREKTILAELRRALQIQRDCRARVESLAAELPERQRIDQAEVDRMQAVVHRQRDVDQILAGSGEGVPARVAALLDDMETNRVVADEVCRRMSILLDDLRRVGRERLPMIDRELTTAVKNGQVDLEEGGQSSRCVAAADALKAAAAHQDAVIASLMAWTVRMAHWDSYERLSRRMDQLYHWQFDLSRRTVEVGRRTVTRTRSDLPAQDLAELGRLADRQRELARVFDDLLQEMDRDGAESDRQAEQPSSARAVDDALELARRLAIGEQMLTAGQQIDRNQIGLAATGQKQIGVDLQRVLAVLTPSESTHSQRARSDAAESPTTGDAEEPRANDVADRAPGDRPDGAASSRTAREPEVVDLQVLMDRLWGELPDRDRPAMVQLPAEAFPPQYRRQIEAYYRRLAKGMMSDE